MGARDAARRETLRLRAGAPQERPAAGTPLRLKVGRYGMAATTVGAAVYVIGGCGPDGLLGDVEVIQPREGTVTRVEPGLLPRRYHAAVSVGDRLYILGGVAGKGLLPTPLFERVDLRNGSVTPLAPLPTPRSTLAAVAHAGKIYALGGADAARKRVGTLEVYDIAADRWSAGPPLPLPRECPAAVYNGVIWVPGGFDGKQAVAAVDAFDIQAGAWGKRPDMPRPTSAHRIARLGGRLYSFGDYAQLDRALVCRLATGEWAEARVPFQPSRHAAVATLEASVYVIGGVVASNNSFLDLIQRVTPF